MEDADLSQRFYILLAAMSQFFLEVKYVILVSLTPPQKTCPLPVHRTVNSIQVYFRHVPIILLAFQSVKNVESSLWES